MIYILITNINLKSKVKKKKTTLNRNARSIHLSECDFARILYLYHVMFTVKNSSNYHGGVGVVDITLATRKTNTRCRKRKKDRRAKKTKSRRDEKATGENIGENRNEKERRNYQAHRTSRTSYPRKKSQTKEPTAQATQQKFESRLLENLLE